MNTFRDVTDPAGHKHVAELAAAELDAEHARVKLDAERAKAEVAEHNKFIPLDGPGSVNPPIKKGK